MAATQYQIFIRYLNENNGRVLTNQTTIEWIQSEELFELRKFFHFKGETFAITFQVFHFIYYIWT